MKVKKILGKLLWCGIFALTICSVSCKKITEDEEETVRGWAKFAPLALNAEPFINYEGKPDVMKYYADKSTVIRAYENAVVDFYSNVETFSATLTDDVYIKTYIMYYSQFTTNYADIKADDVKAKLIQMSAYTTNPCLAYVQLVNYGSYWIVIYYLDRDNNLKCSYQK
ncbi:MAG: hypothetical protein Q4B64_06525 [Spirochaetales bacterium]|nr:hypothetical protein [Spirochaetales bacterium]